MLGIQSKDENAAASAENPYAFSDGVEMNNDEILLKWADPQPNYKDGAYKCVNVVEGRLYTGSCDFEYKVLCKMGTNEEESTTVPSPGSSKSDRSRANLPVFALFLAVSIFKTCYALVGPVA